jgi:hypothetical protein
MRFFALLVNAFSMPCLSAQEGVNQANEFDPSGDGKIDFRVISSEITNTGLRNRWRKPGFKFTQNSNIAEIR